MMSDRRTRPHGAILPATMLAVASALIIRLMTRALIGVILAADAAVRWATRVLLWLR